MLQFRHRLTIIFIYSLLLKTLCLDKFVPISLNLENAQSKQFYFKAQKHLNAAFTSVLQIIK